MDNMVELHQLEEDHAIDPCIVAAVIQDGWWVLHRVGHDPCAAMDAYRHHQHLHFLGDDIMVASLLRHRRHLLLHGATADPVRNFTDHLPAFAHLEFIDDAIIKERHTASHHLVISTNDVANPEVGHYTTLDFNTVAIDTVAVNSLRFTFDYYYLGFVVGHHGNAATAANFDQFYTFDYYQTIIIFAV